MIGARGSPFNRGIPMHFDYLNIALAALIAGFCWTVGARIANALMNALGVGVARGP